MDASAELDGFFKSILRIFDIFSDFFLKFSLKYGESFRIIF